MYDHGVHTDVEVQVGDRIIHAHRAILMRSPVFEFALNESRSCLNQSENSGNVLNINDVDYYILDELIRYLYCDEVDNMHDHAIDLLIAADKYEVPNLKQECIAYLMDNIDEFFFADTLIAADEVSGGEDLKAATMDFILKYVRLNICELVSLRNLFHFRNGKRLIGTPEWEKLKDYPIIMSEITEAFFNH